MTSELTLNLPWVPDTAEQVDDLLVRHGPDNLLAYDDGIQLGVRVLDPAGYRSADAVLGDAREQAEPGKVVLVAGALPVEWRPQLRRADVSFMDVSGVVEISWPRIRVSVGRFAQPARRRRSPVPLQKGHAVVVQELLVSAAGGTDPTISDLARAAGSTPSTASRVVSQLAAHGLVSKRRSDHHVRVSVTDPVKLAQRLASRTDWTSAVALAGFVWGRTVWDVAAHLSAAAVEHHVELAVTGRVGAAFLGVIGTSSPSEVRCWVVADGRPLPDIAALLGIEPAPDDESNVSLADDRRRLGVHRSAMATFDEWTAITSHPIRTWCDLHSERRGTEFAAQLWGVTGLG